MALPNGIEARSKDEWLKLAGSSDPAQRKQVTDALRALGLAAPDFMSWDADKRVGFIMEKQGDAGGEKKGGGKDANTSTAGSGGGKASGGGGGMSDADRALLKENNALLRKIHDLLCVQIFTDPKVKANAEEMDVKVELLGNG